MRTVGCVDSFPRQRALLGRCALSRGHRRSHHATAVYFAGPLLLDARVSPAFYREQMLLQSFLLLYVRCPELRQTLGGNGKPGLGSLSLLCRQHSHSGCRRSRVPVPATSPRPALRSAAIGVAGKVCGWALRLSRLCSGDSGTGCHTSFVHKALPESRCPGRWRQSPLPQRGPATWTPSLVLSALGTTVRSTWAQASPLHLVVHLLII